MFKKLKENLPMIGVGALAVFMVFGIVFLMFKKDHVVEGSDRVIDNHVYQRVYTNGKTHLVNDPNCPECRKITENIVDSMLKAREIN